MRLIFGQHQHSEVSLTLDTQLSWPRKGRVFQIHFWRVFQIHFRLLPTYFFDFGKLSVECRPVLLMSGAEKTPLWGLLLFISLNHYNKTDAHLCQTSNVYK